jgi:hypothetical protein
MRNPRKTGKTCNANGGAEGGADATIGQHPDTRRSGWLGPHYLLSDVAAAVL